MSKNSPLAELRRKMRETVVSLMTDDGLSSNQLILRLQEEHPDEIEQAKNDLAGIGLQKIVQEIMPRHRGSSTQPAAQFTLPLSLKGIVPPDAISVPDKSNAEGPSVRWVPFRRAKFEHLNAHLGLLHSSIEHDRARMREMKRIVDALKPLMTKHPNWTVEDAVRAINKAQAKRGKAA